MTSHATIRKRLYEAENDLELEIAEVQCLFTRPFQTDLYQKGGGMEQIRCNNALVFVKEVHKI